MRKGADTVRPSRMYSRLRPVAGSSSYQLLPGRTELVRRFTRNLLTERLRRQIAESVPYSIALEGLGMAGG